MQRVSASSLACFRACPRKYQHQYINWRTPVRESSALSFGRAWHAVLERWWSQSPEAAITWLVTEAENISPEDGARLAAMLSFYRPPRHEYEVEAVETEFCLPIPNPDTGRRMRGYELVGKLDVRARKRSDGSPRVIEHKTTSEEILGFGPYWQRMAIDHQVSIYTLATGAAAVLYDVARKLSIRLCGKDEFAATSRKITPSEAFQQRCEAEIEAEPTKYYAFRELVKTGDDLAEASADLYQQVQMLHSCRRMGTWPRNSSACRGLFGTCPFLDVCTGRASLDDTSLFGDWAGEADQRDEVAA